MEDGPSSMPGCPHLNKEAISIDRLKISLPNFQTTKLSQTSGRGSTSIDVDSSPFWNSHVEEVSRRLWLPTKIACAELDMNSCLGSSKGQMLGSLSLKTRIFQKKTNLSTISSPSFTCSLVDSTDVENTNIKSKAPKKRKAPMTIEEKEEKRALKRAKQGLPMETEEEIMKRQRKVKLSLASKKAKTEERKRSGTKQVARTFSVKVDSIDQRKILMNWFDGFRYTYNGTLGFIIKYRKRHKQMPTKDEINARVLRSGKGKGGPLRPGHKECSWLLRKYPFLMSIPKDIRQPAIGEAVTSNRTNAKKVATGQIRRFSMKFKSKRNPDACITIPKSNLCFTPEGVKVFFRTNGGGSGIFLRFKRPLKNVPNPSGEMKICRNGNDLSIRVIIDISFEEKQLPDHDHVITSLDPGVRTFQTAYSTDGRAMEFGYNIAPLGRIQRRINFLRKVLKKKSKDLKRKERFKINKAINKLRNKLRRKVDDYHHKVSAYLTKTSDVILLPHFETSKMLKSKTLRKKTKREMNIWRHYHFKCVLRHHANKRGKILLECDESYTSRTCTGCGIMRKKSSSKDYSCAHCNQCFDRDILGARNVLLRCIFAAHERR